MSGTPFVPPAHRHPRRLLERAVDALIAEYGPVKARDMLVIFTELLELSNDVVKSEQAER